MDSLLENQTNQTNNEKKRKPLNLPIIIITAVIVIVVIIVILSIAIKPTINLNNYLTVSAEGYDTVGTAVLTFDTQSFAEDYSVQIDAIADKKYKELRAFKDREDYEKFYFTNGHSNTDTNDFLAGCVNGSLDKKSELSNGDVITFTWKCDDEYAKAYGYKLKYKDVQYKVKDLEKAEIFDPFEGVTASFTGISSKGILSLNEKSPVINEGDIIYTADKSKDLSNGDVVTVTIKPHGSDDAIEFCLDKYGKIPSPTSKEFKVEGLLEYVKSASEISESDLKKMKDQAKDEFNADVANTWSDRETLKSFEYIGNYLLTKKSSGGNRLYLVYKAQVRNTFSGSNGSYDKTNSFYWYLMFSDVLIDADGNIDVEITSGEEPKDKYKVDTGLTEGNWVFSTVSWNYRGYGTLDDLYKAVVTANADIYNHEDNIDSTSDSEKTE